MNARIQQRGNLVANKDELGGRIGRNVKSLRKESGLSQKSLAEATELSPTLISRIENGLLRPSIGTLELIANTLKVDIGYFFRDDEEKGYVISNQGSRKVETSKRGYHVEFVVEGMENAFMEPAIVTTKGKDKEHEVDLAVHDGQEFMYVLEGRLELTLGKKEFTLRKGDAAYWHGIIPHRGISLSKRQARTLNVHLIPGKRIGTFW